MDLESSFRWLFEWVFADEARMWVFAVVTVVAILMGAGASLLDLGVEFGISAAAGLLLSAHSGFFFGFCLFSVLFLLLYAYMGAVASYGALATDLGISTLCALVAWYWWGFPFGLGFFSVPFFALYLIRGRGAPDVPLSHLA